MMDQILDAVNTLRGEVAELRKEVADIRSTTDKVGDVIGQVETLFSEDNIMTALSGFMGGEIPAIGK